MSSRKKTSQPTSGTTLREFLELLERYSRLLAEFRETPRGEVIRRWELNKWAEECRERIKRSASAERLHLLWELDGVGLENAGALLAWVRKKRATLCLQRTESEVDRWTIKELAAAIGTLKQETGGQGDTETSKRTINSLDNIPPLDQTDVEMLLFLEDKYPATVIQTEMEQIGIGTRKVLSKRLNVLRKYGYVERPKGERRGERLTPLGLALADKLQKKQQVNAKH
jgi:hypothetical protein